MAIPSAFNLSAAKVFPIVVQLCWIGILAIPMVALLAQGQAGGLIILFFILPAVWTLKEGLARQSSVRAEQPRIRKECHDRRSPNLTSYFADGIMAFVEGEPELMAIRVGTFPTPMHSPEERKS